MKLLTLLCITAWLGTVAFSCNGMIYKDVVLSKKFNVCLRANKKAVLSGKIPVDIEYVKYIINDRLIKMEFSPYPGDRSKDNKVTRSQIGGDLDVMVINKLVNDENIVFTVEFKSPPDGVLPSAYADVSLERSGNLGKDKSFLMTFLKGWHACL